MYKSVFPLINLTHCICCFVAAAAKCELSFRCNAHRNMFGLEQTKVENCEPGSKSNPINPVKSCFGTTMSPRFMQNTKV